MSKAIIYSLLPRLWGNLNPAPTPNGTLEQNGSGRLSDLSDTALTYIRELGATHLWCIGLLEHATATPFVGIEADPSEIVKGIAGSPYAVRDYYDVAPALSTDPTRRMQELEALIQRVHDAGLKLLMDFIPNHVARTYHSDVAPIGTIDLGAEDDKTTAFSPSNNFYYLPNQALQLPNTLKSDHEVPTPASAQVDSSYREYPARATGNDCFSATPSEHDWYETSKLCYGVDYLSGGAQYFDPIPATWWRMLEILHFWASKGIDGFRCDMAEMVPPAFWAWAIPQLRQDYDLMFLAEIYQPHRYGEYLSAGFDYLYDKVGMYDQLRAVIRGEASASSLDPIREASGLQGSMCYFLENHDEQRLASDYFSGDATHAYPALAVAVLSGSNPYLHYFAGELGEPGMDAEGFSGRDGRTSIFDYWSLATLRRLGADYRGEALTDTEQALLNYHRRILSLARDHEVLSSGSYFGLNYLQDEHYDHHRLMSFVRYTDRGLVLVLANFATEGRIARLRLTHEVFDAISWLEPNTPLQAEDLLTGDSYITTLTTLAPLVAKLPALSATLIYLEPAR